MKRLFLILTILLSTTSSFAQTGSPVQFSGGGKFEGGVLTKSLTIGAHTIYFGNAAYSATGEDYVTLPVNIAETSIAFDSDTVGYIRAEVTGKNSTDSSCIHVELKAEYENFGDTLAFIGSPSSTTSQLNAATWSVVLSAADDDLSILATGTPGTIWQVKKLEIGGL